MKRCVCFGIGKIYQQFLKMYNKNELEIQGGIDNNPAKQNQILYGYKVYAPHEIHLLNPDYIIITTAYADEIKEQLLSLGVNENIILDFYSLYKKLKPTENNIWTTLLNLSLPHLASQDEKTQAHRLEELQRKTLFLEAKNFIRAMPKEQLNSLAEVEFQVFSQCGEDGIIQYLVNNTNIPNKIFIEFGVEDYSEANTRFLLMNNNWSGLVIDGSKRNMDALRQWQDIWKYDLQAVDTFITRDNINDIILNAGIKGDIGLLSVDIDGNDYWVLNAINCVHPRILICEYNASFGDTKKVTIPYDENFYVMNAHYSGLYCGVSLAALRDYAEKKGYYFFGTNSQSTNAFFVRKDSIDEALIPRNSTYFYECKMRTSRDQDGNLNFLKGNARLEVIKAMPLVDLETGKTETISKIYADIITNI